MVFRKRKVYNDPHRWYYGNDELCIVCEFNYLGVVLNYNGRFIKHSRMVTGKALKSLNVLMSNTRQVLLSPKIACQLFDVFVGSVLMYGTEIWGFTKETSVKSFFLLNCQLQMQQLTESLGGFLSIYVNILRYLNIGLKYYIAITVF